MLQRLIYITVFMMGLLLQPIASFACEEANTHAPMSCCAKNQKAHKEPATDCCTDPSALHSEGEKNNCPSDASCHCPIVKAPIYMLPVSASVSQSVSCMHTGYPSAFTARPKSGFAATWLLPKIA